MRELADPGCLEPGTASQQITVAEPLLENLGGTFAQARQSHLDAWLADGSGLPPRDSPRRPPASCPTASRCRPSGPLPRPAPASRRPPPSHPLLSRQAAADSDPAGPSRPGPAFWWGHRAVRQWAGPAASCPTRPRSCATNATARRWSGLVHRPQPHLGGGGSFPARLLREVGLADAGPRVLAAARKFTARVMALGSITSPAADLGCAVQPWWRPHGELG